MVYHFYSALDLSAQMIEMWQSTAFGNGALDFHLKLHCRTANNENNNWPQWNQQRDATTSILMMRALTSLCTKSSGHLPWNKNHLPDIQRNHDHCQHQAVYLIADWSNMLIRTCCAAHTLHTDHLGYRWDFVTDTLDMCGGWYGISERSHSHCQRVSGGNLMQDVVLQNNGGEYLTRSAQRELLNLVEYARGERGLNEKGICRMFLCKHNRPCPTCICAKHCIISMFCGRPRLEVRLME